MRVSRLRESNLQSVGWSWLPGALPPACSSLCNTHCKSAHRHLLGGAQKGHGVQTGSRGMNPAPTTAVSSFTSVSPAPAQESPKQPPSLHFCIRHSISRSAEQWILSASLGVHRSERGYFSTSSAFCLLPREKRGKMQRKDFFFKWRWSEGYWNKPKQEPEITNMEEKAQNNQELEEKLGQRFLEEATTE